MHSEPRTTAAAPPVEAVRRRRALIALCITEITSWGVLYYAFPVLAPAITRDTGWSLPAVTWAFSTSQIVSALAGIAVGRWLDRRGPRGVMTAGSVVAVIAVVGIAHAPSYGSFLLAWGVAGFAMAATFYPPAFAALTRWYGPDRVRALTALTLVAGLASTVFAPLTAALNDHLDWRGTYLVLAVVVGVVTIPLHAGLRLPWPHADHAERSAGNGHASEIARSRPFLALLATMALGGFGVYAVVINQVPLLSERGFDSQLAAWALGLGGVGQVLGRLGYAQLQRRTGPRGRTVIILAACAVTTAVLGMVPGPEGLLIVAAMLVGMARGVFTLLQATAVSDRWGTAAYGRLSGLLSAPLMIAIALAPWGGSAIAAALGGFPALFLVLGAMTAVSALLALATRPAVRTGG
ncbi:MFS transporter [Saccharopolyspora endophytica]|uniref:MFS transporter n=1 Tax=Saccharopolyspora endophytica TaxID=543886 RepID=A0ABS5DK33_9PSEU|nr:MFS transporter [Saccharopolyspora endophytica]MBQ0926646.1 MFS transporter [Saccharopolyspora endophytica]